MRQRDVRDDCILTSRSFEFGEIEQGEEEVLVDLNRHLLDQHRCVLEVGDTVSYINPSAPTRKAGEEITYLHP